MNSPKNNAADARLFTMPRPINIMFLKIYLPCNIVCIIPLFAS